jgi:trehalose 6-phosphate synthase
MNLVAKEFVAAQNPEDPGVLILSRFAGAAVECKPALLVNPYDADSTAAAIYRALSMPLRERRARHEVLFGIIRENDIQYWPDRFLSALTRLDEMESTSAAPGARSKITSLSSSTSGIA